MQEMQFLFVGEEQSRTAKERGWVWGDPQLCSRTLLESIDESGVFSRENARFINLFENGTVQESAVQFIKEFSSAVIGMGKKVQKELTKNGIGHYPLIHPAARGKIRKRELYHAHVRETLTDIIEKER